MSNSVKEFTYANKVGAIHCETSAKNNTGVEEMFLTLTQKMINLSEEKEQISPLTRRNSQKRNIVIVDDDQKSQDTKSCCGS